MIDDALLKLMSPDELKAYQELLRHETAMLSPLDLACYMFPETRRWDHLELLNLHLLALAEYRLTEDGPLPVGVPVRWWYVEENSPTGTRIKAKGPTDMPEKVDAYGAYGVVGKTKIPIVFQLAVSMMPRAGKSRLITEVFPLWLLLKDPDMQIGLATYSDTFAGDWGEAMKQVTIAHHSSAEEAGVRPLLPFPEGGTRAAKDIFRVRGAQGKIRYSGTGGAVTGKTLHTLIADDLVKNEDDMLSEATRLSIHRFIDSTWKTRKTRNLVPGCFLPIPIEVRMATRWHRMDPIGYSCYDHETNEKNSSWCVLNIPALAIEGPDEDPLGREIGQAHANAAGLTKGELEELRLADPRTFSALYQGNPAIEGGGLISTDFRTYWTNTIEGEMWIFWRGLPAEPGGVPLIYSVRKSECIVFAVADMAATKKTASDYTVLGTFAYSREFDVVFMLSWYRKRITTDQYNEELLPIIQDDDCATTIVENVTYGQVFGQSLEKAKMQVEYADVLADKVARVVSSKVSGRIRSGGWRVPKEAPWLGLLVSEASLFPNDDHDDQVDVIAFASSFVNDLPDWKPPRQREMKSLVEQLDEHVEKQHRRNRPGRSTRGAWGGLQRRR